ncbi:TPA: 6,7-dimethyl-8-ribityllumazine synthase [bacterium]|nr:6,7-dimethyl-8-ribityllumazine synthase [bacterium]
MKVYEGRLDGKGIRVGIVVSRFNEFISKMLLDGCIDTLKRHNVDDNDISIFYCPGSFEIPYIARKIAKDQDIIIALGVIIRGDTPHFNYIASEVAKGVAKVSLDTGISVIFGVITSDTIEQAIERAGTKSGNKGRDAALSAIEMVSLCRAIDERKK